MRTNRTVAYFISRIRILPHLSLKEKDILISRLKESTLAGIGERYKVTEGRIRQIEKRAILKMKLKMYQQRLFKMH